MSIATNPAPLAERMRPTHLDEVLGHTHLLGTSGILRSALGQSAMPSFLLWGPPGCGKTTIARLVAQETGAHFLSLSAVLSGIKDLRILIKEAREKAEAGQRSLLFVDEIHRWNKAQQDALLPHVEKGDVTLIGATTENPSFQIIAPLRSRCEVLVLHALEPDALEALLSRALEDRNRGLGTREVEVEASVLTRLAEICAGDARRALTLLENLVESTPEGGRVDESMARERLKLRDILYDRAGEEHFNLISAFIKSLRGSDPDAALYWLARMLKGGEDANFLARRLLIFASEDVGNADPRALLVATAAAQAVQMVGLPEARIHLGQAATYLACAPKSNAAYRGIDDALREVDQSGALEVPLHLRNAPTALLKKHGYGQGYRYPHDHPHGFVEQQYLPDDLVGRRFYEPVDWAHEKTIRERLAWWRNQKS